MNINQDISMHPNSKIKVFISSKCDKAGEPPKYAPIRSELKQVIEKTGLASVYTFEDEAASTLSAGDHYTFALEDSDVCIFLIDNADGVSSGVQVEIDVVRKNNIKALYYFCDENKKEKTALEKSLMGAIFAKSKTVHKFSDLSENSANALIEDIVSIYHYYCVGKLQVADSGTNDKMQDLNISAVSKYQETTLPKSVLKNIDKTVDFILAITTGISFNRSLNQIQTSELDDWGVQFLPILFEGKSIKEFNASIFLDCLNKLQDKNFFNVVNLRWRAIQSYFNGNIEKCIENMQEALVAAKNTSQPSWIINDILIDLRNQHFEFCSEKNIYSESNAQKELDASEDELYYPIIDRSNESLNEKYIQGFYNKATKSPYTVPLRNDVSQYGKLLASTLIVALYNGSLTHILLFYNKIKDFLFYLSNCYDNWNFKRDLLKYAIITGTREEVLGVQNAYPEILRKLSAKDAEIIMKFCSQHPICYKRSQQQLLAFGTVGYYLSDETFKVYESHIIKLICSWLEDKHAVKTIGQSIFNNLSNISNRLSQDIIADICCKFIDKHYSRWYIDMFKFMYKCININKMSKENSKKLIDHIILVIQDKKERELIKYSALFLCSIRNQNRLMTEDLDKAIGKYLPDYYKNIYKLETTDNKTNDLPQFIEKYVQSIKANNQGQGIKSTCYGCDTREIATIRAILVLNNLQITDDLMDSIIKTISQTLLKSKESVSTKMDAVSLLCCIIVKYPQSYIRNKNIYQEIFDKEEQISGEDDFPFSSNIDNIALKISLRILFSAMEIDLYADLVEFLPYLKDNIATTISVSNFIAEYLELSGKTTFAKSTESVILYNAFAWLHMNYVNIRYNATRILMALLRNQENQGIINRQIISLIDTDDVYIKNLIIWHIFKNTGITEETKNYVLEVCKHDSNYVTRMLCKNVNFFD